MHLAVGERFAFPFPVIPSAATAYRLPSACTVLGIFSVLWFDVNGISSTKPFTFLNLIPGGLPYVTGQDAISAILRFGRHPNTIQEQEMAIAQTLHDAAPAAKPNGVAKSSEQHDIVLKTFRLLIADLCQQFNGGHPGYGPIMSKRKLIQC